MMNGDYMCVYVCVSFSELYRVTDNDLKHLLHPVIEHFTFPRSALPVQPYHSLPLTVTHWCIMGLSLCAGAVIAAHQTGRLTAIREEAFIQHLVRKNSKWIPCMIPIDISIIIWEQTFLILMETNESFQSWWTEILIWFDES